MNGSAASNALPSRCSSVTPVNAVASTITSRPIKPTSARWKPSANDQDHRGDGLHDQHRDIARRALRLLLAIVIFEHLCAPRRASACHNRTSAAARRCRQVSRPATSTGSDDRRHVHEELHESPAGLLRRSADSAARRPGVITPPSAVPDAACIIRPRRNARNASRSERCKLLHVLVVPRCRARHRDVLARGEAWKTW